MKRAQAEPRTRRSYPRPATQSTLTIGLAARESGVSAKMIRYYEREGLLRRAPRTAGNYRLYGDRDIHTLHFIHRARRLGFSMDQLRVLLALWADRRRPSALVKKVALEHIAELDERIRQLRSMRDTLSDLAKRCAGDDRPDCPIIVDLAGSES